MVYYRNITHTLFMKQSLLLALLLVPMAAFASEVDNLIQNIEELNTAVEVHDTTITNIQTDERYEANTDLFPRGRGFDDNDAELLQAQPVADTAVTVKVDGTTIALTDVQLSAWYGPYVRDMAEANIITGYKNDAGALTGMFGPADGITIAQLAKIAILASGGDVTQCPKESINELAHGTWAETYIGCAELLRWSVFTDTSRDPNTPANRAEVTVTFMEAFERPYVPVSGAIFTDVSSTYIFRAPIETAYRDGIVTGYKDEKGNPTNLFGPTNAINRAEVAKIASLARQIYGK